jgi:hypothetical protein
MFWFYIVIQLCCSYHLTKLLSTYSICISWFYPMFALRILRMLGTPEPLGPLPSDHWASMATICCWLVVWPSARSHLHCIIFTKIQKKKRFQHLHPLPAALLPAVKWSWSWCLACHSSLAKEAPPSACSSGGLFVALDPPKKLHTKKSMCWPWTLSFENHGRRRKDALRSITPPLTCSSGNGHLQLLRCSTAARYLELRRQTAALTRWQAIAALRLLLVASPASDCSTVAWWLEVQR